ncbi:MAG TPA: hypothetical protein VK491_09925 [Gemmatimonadaceae bacterium]|nr:hypothetical protein [Gemmatimonadaceae bacterium]
MKYVLSGIFLVALAAVPLACNPFAPDQSVVLEVESLDAPATISPGAQITVVLTVTTGGCTVFDHIAVLRGPSGAQLAAIGLNTAKGKTNYSCPADIRSDPHSYTLEPPFQSPFTVQVNRPTSPPLVATVLVE